MALVLVAGALIGKAVAELLDAVKATGKKLSSFKSILKRIESTLETIKPRLDEIILLNEKLNQPEVGNNDLVALVRDGKVLVDKCSKVHPVNYVKSKDIKQMLANLQKNDSADSSVLQSDEAEGSSSRKRRDDQAYCDKPVMTREERARGALLTISAENKKETVLNYVDSLKKQFGNGVSTKCIVYNATGDTVKHVGNHDWVGNIGPAHYPLQIENGQWGGFLHVKTVGPPSGSVGAVVYRGKNLKDEDCDWLLSWYNPWCRFFQDNRVYTEIRQAQPYEQNYWDYIRGKLASSSKTRKDNWNGCSSSMTSGTGFTIVVEVIMTLENA